MNTFRRFCSVSKFSTIAVLGLATGCLADIGIDEVESIGESQSALAGHTPSSLVVRAGYDYDATGVYDGTYQKIWWCGYDVHDAADAIFYKHFNTVYPYDVSDVVKVLGGSRTVGGGESRWNSLHVCAPSVVKGSWTLSGKTYSYAMYYSGARVCVSGEVCGLAGSGAPYGLSPAQIGVVYSQDGINWDGQLASYNPVVPSTCMNNPLGSSNAGAKMETTSQVRLFWADGCVGRGKVALFNLGYSQVAGSSKLLSNTGYGSPIGWGYNDFAADSSNNRLYVTAPHTTCGPTTGCNWGIWYMPYASAIAGTGSWTFEADVTYSSYSSKFQRIDQPGWLKNGNGDVGPLRGAFSGGYRWITGGEANAVDNMTNDIWQVDIY
jgi:hypothetical protein